MRAAGGYTSPKSTTASTSSLRGRALMVGSSWVRMGSLSLLPLASCLSPAPTSGCDDSSRALDRIAPARARARGRRKSGRTGGTCDADSSSSIAGSYFSLQYEPRGAN